MNYQVLRLSKGGCEGWVNNLMWGRVRAEKVGE